MTDKDLIGLTKEEAKAKCEEAGFRIRVTRVDGEPGVIQASRCLDRYNVHLENGVVTYAAIG